MEGIFAEFENENALRVYPFAAGCTPPDGEGLDIPCGVFVDAALYPINPDGALYLSSISWTGVFSVSDDNGVVMTGVREGASVELYDVSDFSRHVGTLLAASPESLAEFADRGVLREYKKENTTFSSSCVFPVVIDGVLSLKVGDAKTATGDTGFANAADDDVRVSSAELPDGRRTIRFDVLPRPAIAADNSIKRIICVVDGQTPFRLERMSYNTVALTLNGIDKEDVCAAAHRENQYEMTDTCKCKETGTCTEAPVTKTVPEYKQLEEVYIPPDPEVEVDGEKVHVNGGLTEGSENAFYLVVPNITYVNDNPVSDQTGYKYANPLSITLVDGAAIPNTDGIQTVAKGEVAELADGEMLDSVTSKGVVLQVPGLSGGML